MTRLVLAIAALIVVVAAIGYGAWQMLKLDTSEDAFATSYSRNFIESCVEGAKKSIVASGGTVDEKRQAELDYICTCGADVSAKELQARGPLSMGQMMDLQNDPEFRERIGSIMKTCRQQFNAQ